jgi:nucleoside-diphosphate-sugar epimerase
VIVLTGGTGLVGSEWLHRLPSERVIALTRRPERITLGQPIFCDLAESVAIPPDDVEVIIHSAADIKFSASIEQSRANNVTATENLLRFASRCRRLRKFVFVSTVYLAGDREGEIHEAPVLPAPAFFSSYEQTKHEAEEMVFAAMRELPISILRLSSVVGSTSGEVRQWNYFHQLLRLAPSNPLPVIPARPDALVDMIPVDWAVSVMQHIVENAWSPGAVYHVCAGPERAMTVSHTFNVAYAALGGSAKQPRMATLAECDEFYKTAGGRRAEIWQTMRTYLPHLGLRQVFRNDRCRSAIDGSGIEWMPVEQFLDRVIERTLSRSAAS